MAIRSHPGVLIFQLTTNHFGIFGLSALDLGCSPARHMSLSVPLPISASSAFFSHFLSHEGEAVDAVTPAGLPRGPLPLRRTSSSTLRQGRRLLGPGGEFRREVWSLATSPPRFQGFPCSSSASSHPTFFTLRRRLLAMRVPSCSPMRTSSSPLCITEKCTTDLRRTRVRETGWFLQGQLSGPGQWVRFVRPACPVSLDPGPRAKDHPRAERGLSVMVGCPVLKQ